MAEEKDKPYLKAFAQAAKDLQGELLFVTSGLKRGAQSRLGEYLNFGKEDLPVMVVIEQKE